MQKYTLHFSNISSERLYQQFRWDFNNFPSKLLLLFNIVVQIACMLIGLKNERFLTPFYGLFSMIILVIFFYVYKKFKQRHYLQDFYILLSIVFPFMAGTYFGCISLEENPQTGYHWYLGGVTFQMFFSYLFKFRINWYNLMIAKGSGFIFLLVLDLTQYSVKVMSDQIIILFILNVFGIYFDYIQEKYERNLWEKD